MNSRQEMAKKQLEMIQDSIGKPTETPREALEAWIDFYSAEIPFFAPFFQTIKEPILATYDLLENRTNEMNRLMDELMGELNKEVEPSVNPNDPNHSENNSNSNDNNTNAPDSGNNNDEDNAPDHLTPPPPRDPLVLDTNKDGFISTVALSDSNAYFDITGDGIKERVSWIVPNDGILVYDKNESGKIDGIDEVFGNFTKNGFEELKELIDSNHDGKIDRQDELFNRLQIWNDLNGDGTTQTNELSGLKDTGVKSIDLNYVNTNITLGGIVNISFLPMNNIDFRTKKEVV